MQSSVDFMISVEHSSLEIRAKQHATPSMKWVESFVESILKWMSFFTFCRIQNSIFSTHIQRLTIEKKPTQCKSLIRFIVELCAVARITNYDIINELASFFCSCSFTRIQFTVNMCLCLWMCVCVCRTIDFSFFFNWICGICSSLCVYVVLMLYCFVVPTDSIVSPNAVCIASKQFSRVLHLSPFDHFAISIIIDVYGSGLAAVAADAWYCFYFPPFNPIHKSPNRFMP